MSTSTPPMSHEAIAREARAHWLDALRDHGLGRSLDELSLSFFGGWGDGGARGSVLHLDADGTIDHPFEEASVLYFLIDGAALERGEFGVARPWYGATL